MIQIGSMVEQFSTMQQLVLFGSKIEPPLVLAKLLLLRLTLGLSLC